MHPEVRSAAEAGGSYVLDAESFSFGDIDLDKLAFMDGQLDGAKTQFCKGIQYRANGLGNGKAVRL